ncbi:30S ribosomal protein S5 [Candidatus Pacearchaeota archaeon CG10_big_fil_rev_8_21_14_0_10_34_76]|nr:MAG: 30S ribosomal protein S5 [Candidatus Pacearchaeota archaeon CG10_big_fil_rev_8_21_14_0_10_34_76]
MAERENKNQPKNLIEPTPENLDLNEELIIEPALKEEEAKREPTLAEKRVSREKQEKEDRLASWAPITQLGKDVKSGKENNIDNILENRKKILEPEIVDYLLGNLESDLLLIGQAKGKFGGGKRRAWRQTQKKTKEGNVLTFSAMAVVGDKKGHIGLGTGKAKETLPAREKALRKAKLNLIKIRRGCAHFDCSCGEDHTVPFVVEGKSGSVRVKLMPAPQGTGLVIGDELKKMLRLVGIKDIYAFSMGQTRTTFNHAKACFDALEKTTKLVK